MAEQTGLNEHIRDNRRTGEIEFYIEERGPERVVSRMPIKKGALNPLGLVQAGAMVWLADVTATVLILERTGDLDAEGRGFPLAVNLQTLLLGNQREGELTAEARVVRHGRRLTVIRTTVTGDQGRLLMELTSTHVPSH